MSEKDVEFDVETGEEIKETDLPETNAQDEEDDDNDERLSDNNSSDDEDNQSDEEDDNERSAIRERRREERQRKKQAAREREDTMRRELAARDAIISEMQSKLAAIENRNAGSELAQIENGKREAAKAYQFFKDQIRVAGEAGNYAAVADATEKMIQAQRKFEELNNVETAFKQRQSAPQPLDPRLMNHAQRWMEKNKWYDPTGRDQDSEIAMRLDQRLAQEGWDPTTESYWQELDSRLKKYLPHRAKSGSVQTAKPKSVVSGSGRETSGSAAKDSYRLSADRVQALRDAGIWDDPKARSEAIKRYREYDKQNQG